MAAWQREWLETVYGPGVTLPDRQAFLERYGCTGWTNEVLEALMEIGGGGGFTSGGSGSGYVEIGAGNGQWARVLTDRYKQQQRLQQQHEFKTTKHYDFVLAYDNGSSLPLRRALYHRSRPEREHFYPHVWPLVAGTVAATVRQWPCRGRVLLLVYPPTQSDLALSAVQAYDAVAGHTIVYVGEGRGGANADAAFFDYLEDPARAWYLDRVMDVASFGSKGHEKMFVLRKKKGERREIVESQNQQ